MKWRHLLVGIALLAIWLATLQIVLDRGQEEDWFQSNWICWLSAISVADAPSAVAVEPTPVPVAAAVAPAAPLTFAEVDASYFRKSREARAQALIEEFGLSRVADSLGETLSGGERRRAEIARSLIPNPRFILFDEPFAGVDPIAVGELQRLIGSLRDRGIGVLITDHAVREALGICNRAYILSSGTILEAGTPAEIARSAKARAVYLGEKFRLDEPAGELTR